jgi:hypothetical protein
MTTISGNTFALAPLADSKKGPFENRIRCTGEHMGNNIKANLATTATIGGAVGISTLAAKYPSVANALKIPVDFVKNGISNLLSGSGGKAVKEAFSTGLEFVKNSPTAVKIAAPLILLGIMFKNYYNAGKIDQKYEDRAKVLDNHDVLIKNK